MAYDITKRFDRIVSIYIQLQSKNIVRAQELADRWKISLRTIYRDIRTLEQAGVPIYGEAGTGYRLVEGYRLPPVSFTPEEAKSFVSAQKLMGKFVDSKLQSDFDSALLKIKSVLRSTEKESLSTLERHVIVKDLKSPRFPAHLQNLLHTLTQSLEQKKKVSITYKAGHDEITTERTLEPFGIVHESNYWYLYAYCHLRQDYRQFRTDRIDKVQLLQEWFEVEHPSIHDYLQQQTEKLRLVPKTNVRIRTSKQTAQVMRWEREHFGFVKEEEASDGKMDLYFEYTDLWEYFPRWILMFSDDLQEIEPQSLLERVRFLATSIQENLSRITHETL